MTDLPSPSIVTKSSPQLFQATIIGGHLRRRIKMETNTLEQGAVCSALPHCVAQRHTMTSEELSRDKEALAVVKVQCCQDRWTFGTEAEEQCQFRALMGQKVHQDSTGYTLWQQSGSPIQYDSGTYLELIGLGHESKLMYLNSTKKQHERPKRRIYFCHAASGLVETDFVPQENNLTPICPHCLARICPSESPENQCDVKRPSRCHCANTKMLQGRRMMPECIPEPKDFGLLEHTSQHPCDLRLPCRLEQHEQPRGCGAGQKVQPPGVCAKQLRQEPRFIPYLQGQTPSWGAYTWVMHKQQQGPTSPFKNDL
ncbi:hypothetical protein Anapl_03462 [Anas platyrhynchos]|uniref:Uncharacterized protein n=1 Tax=Anas platyrhynchos TaxID=8839 RepID=R0LF31_ANAPL|nr:hypothetical protein Anapl_03462 [Anas platyrhynchos]